jgi:hypothetical protein
VQLHECMSAVTLDIIAAAAFGSAALSSVETRALFYQARAGGGDERMQSVLSRDINVANDSQAPRSEMADTIESSIE